MGVIGKLEYERAKQLMIALLQVEDFERDRQDLTWRYPEGGESVADLRTRVMTQLLPELITEARKVDSSQVRVLLASHLLLLKELHRLLGDIAKDRDNFDNYHVYWYNTAVSEYVLEVDNDNTIKDVKCNYFACNKHVH